jgi:hypothetical protein
LPRFTFSNQINHSEPQHKWLSCFMKDRTGSNRNLVAAILALIQLPSTYIRILLSLTFGTPKTIRPSLLKQKFMAALLSGKGTLKFKPPWFHDRAPRIKCTLVHLIYE